MAQTIFSLTGRLNPNLLSERMFRQQWKKNIFGMFVAPNFIKASRETSDTVLPGPEADAGAKLTGSPIEVFKEFIKRGKTNLDIPVRLRLTGRATLGDKALEGTEEAARITFRTVRINLTRKAYSNPSLMSAQIAAPYLGNLMEEANEYITDWWNDYHPGNFIHAMLNGVSFDLLAPTLLGGRAVARVSHPNFYTAGAGQVAYSGGRPGTAGYEDLVQEAIDGLTNVAGDYFSADMVNSLVLAANRHKVKPIMMKAGFRRFLIFISDAQWAQLQKDSDFLEFYRGLPNELDDHPLATGARADLFGALIYVDQNMWGARTATNPVGASAPAANVVEYGPAPSAAQRSAGYTVANWIEDRDTSDRKCGFLIGEGALSVGVGIPVAGGVRGRSMMFVEESADYGAVSGIGVQTVQSVVRADIFDHDGVVTGLSAGDFYENTSSLVFATYSPDSLSF
jgi:hypothetical protein